MRVVHLAPTEFGPAGLYGGGERYPVELVRALSDSVDCELVAFGRKPGLRSGRPRVRVLRPFAFLGGHRAHPLSFDLPRALAGADIIHTHHLRSTPSRLAGLLARARRQRAVVTDHGLQGGNWRGLLPALFDRFLCVSAYSARELRSPPDRTRLIYGGADPVRYRPDPAAQRAGVLFVGRLTPHKGVDCLLRALPPNAPLRIVGSSGHDPALPERDYPTLLRELSVGHDVSFLGALGDELLPPLYRQAVVLALPSVHRTCYGREVAVSELLGLVVLEAMASGTPVVCSRLGGLPEIVQDGVTGYLVSPGDPAELRERLAELLADPARAARLGRNARELVLARFTWQACAERCLTAYAELARP